jgi:membrane protein required for beta-lactamase induction
MHPIVLIIAPWLVVIVLLIGLIKVRRKLKVFVKKEGLQEVQALHDVAEAAESTKSKKGGSLEKQVEKDAKTVEDATRAADKASKAL